ncbi:MAG: 2Fe-2S iron-sulfur cluster-binding protein [Alphaproteobacteria bacterium]|nr:2Fe-2S iron-sulfur cluster-binding protein [Alphaproteobacteria bacterium]
MKTVLSLTINGTNRDDVIPDNMLLVDYLRENVGLTGTKIGCDGGECGACTVLINDRPRHSCLTLAVTCQDAKVETVDGLSKDNRLSALQRGFDEKLGSQCGFCTPGMIMASEALLRDNPDPDEAAIRDALAGNICRCTGYVKIIEAVQFAADITREELAS